MVIKSKNVRCRWHETLCFLGEEGVGKGGRGEIRSIYVLVHGGRRGSGFYTYYVVILGTKPRGPKALKLRPQQRSGLYGVVYKRYFLQTPLRHDWRTNLLSLP
jgi:hypothetical protein